VIRLRGFAAPPRQDRRDPSRYGEPPPHSDHYSYAVYADPEMAETFDTLRFSGPIGRLIAETQEQVIVSFLGPLEGKTILDVGTGTGRAALALAARGALVTGVDASAEMLAVAERRAEAAKLPMKFSRGDAHRLDFPDRSFDAVVCLRVLMHTPDWRQSLAELCRVARHRVVLDYPARRSAAALQAAARHAAQALGSRVEAYRVFGDRQIEAALRAEGFRVRDIHRQFVLPIALHKQLASASLTGRVEGVLARIGLARWLGSPVTIVTERCAS
jgi:2-polyprenyl-3-methyl-5-hydroxy-6-metoxy-1,4-benzoquinol methylase